MTDELPTTPLVIRLATPQDIPTIDMLDSYSTSPTRDIHRAMQQYFGSVDPSTHEQTLIFLAEIDGHAAGKAELMIPPAQDDKSAIKPAMIGYVKRVVVHPQYRKLGLAHRLMQHIIDYARTTLQLKAIDLHVWDQNVAAIRLYEALGFELQHRELYFRLSLVDNQGRIN
jgi:ribosomal protein S18 acetylase RimI-like enzyme